MASLFRRDSYDYRPRYHATIDYTYSLPDYKSFKSMRRTLRGFLDAFGVKFDPSIIWNAIPFSFVVDWVVDVGGWLRQFSTNDLGLQVVVHSASHSVKYAQVSQSTARFPVVKPVGFSATLLHYIENIAIADVERTYYERRIWDIPTVFKPGVSIPGLMQWTLGGALGTSREKRRFRHG